MEKNKTMDEAYKELHGACQDLVAELVKALFIKEIVIRLREIIEKRLKNGTK